MGNVLIRDDPIMDISIFITACFLIDVHRGVGQWVLEGFVNKVIIEMHQGRVCLQRHCPFTSHATDSISGTGLCYSSTVPLLGILHGAGLTWKITSLIVY